MIRSLYTAATGMIAQQINQDVVANNLANVQTPGFKSSRAEFQDLMYQVSRQAGVATTSGTALPLGMEIGLGSKLTSIQKSFTQGDYQQTGNRFDWAIEGDGFFQVDDGNGKTLYTRAGGWKISKDLYLVNSEGLKLTPEVTVPAGTVTFTVDAGGTWTSKDKAGATLSTGRLELAKFANPAGLTNLGRNLYAKTDGSGEPVTGNPDTEGFGTISQTFLEMSNVNVVDEMVQMIIGQRAYEINSKAIQTADNMLQLVNNLKR
jgi:flagellar basal-body rod protein FlgG